MEARVPDAPIRNPADPPAMLLLGHCVPQRAGRDHGGPAPVRRRPAGRRGPESTQARTSADRDRGWRLLDTAARRYRVYLACLCDGPIHLDAWRALHALTEALILVPPRPLAAALDLLLGRLDPWSDRGVVGRRSLARAVGPWCRRTRFDALLCTHPLLGPAAAGIGAEIRMCDLPPGTLLPPQRGPAGFTHAIVDHAPLIPIVRRLGFLPVLVSDGPSPLPAALDPLSPPRQLALSVAA